MSKLLKSKWFKPIALTVLVITVIAVAVIVVSSSPEKQDMADTAVDSVILKPDTTSAAVIKDNEELAMLDEQDVVATDYVETEFIKDAKDFDSVTDLDYVELDESKNGAAAKWVDGKAVPMSLAEIAAFEEQLYACQTVEEYEALLEAIAYYNKGIDMSKFPWHWDELNELYSDEQIEMMKNGTREYKTVPNVVGMEVKEAYRLMTKMGFLARCSYYYEPKSDLPVGYCYFQDIAPGTKWNTDACIMLSIQAPEEITREAINWDPDDQDFDIEDVAKDINENGVYAAIVPNVIGLPKDEALRALEAAGFKNAYASYMYGDRSIPYGCCFDQELPPGIQYPNNVSFGLLIQMDRQIPSVIGMSESQATQCLTRLDLEVIVEYQYDADSNMAQGLCTYQSLPAGEWNLDPVILLYFQAENPNSLPVPTETPIPEPTPELTPEPNT